MKRLLLALFFVVISLVGMAQGQPSFLNTFVPDNRVHDFGTIYEKDGKVVHVFRFTNKGKKPVAISEVNTWCGCMVPTYTKKATRPGETAEVKVEFDPDHKNGNFVKQVVLLLNDGRNYARVWIKANVIPYVHPVQEDHPYYFGYGLYMSQKLLPFPELKVGQSYTFDVHIANDTNKPMTIKFLREPNNTVLKMPSSLKLKPKQRTSFKVSYTWFRKHKSTRYVNVYPIINGKKGKPLVVRWNVGKKFHLLGN